jgi:hypothetical protein
MNKYHLCATCHKFLQHSSLLGSRLHPSLETAGLGGETIANPTELTCPDEPTLQAFAHRCKGTSSPLAWYFRAIEALEKTNSAT